MADLDASAAKDALGPVIDNGWAVPLRLGGNFFSAVCGFFYAEFVGIFLKVAAAGPLAGKAILRMVGKQKVDEHSASALQLFGVGADAHTLGRGIRTRRHKSTDAFDLDKAKPTRTGGR